MALNEYSDNPAILCLHRSAFSYIERYVPYHLNIHFQSSTRAQDEHESVGLPSDTGCYSISVASFAGTLGSDSSVPIRCV